jgi:hypothetical protein
VPSQILKATKAKPIHLAATLINRVPGATVTAYTVRGVIHVELPGALVAGPFSLPRKKTVLRPETAVRFDVGSFLCQHCGWGCSMRADLRFQVSYPVQGSTRRQVRRRVLVESVTKECNLQNIPSCRC